VREQVAAAADIAEAVAGVGLHGDPEEHPGHDQDRLGDQGPAGRQGGDQPPEHGPGVREQQQRQGDARLRAHPLPPGRAPRLHTAAGSTTARTRPEQAISNTGDSPLICVE
jgi:hypothetical protein